jgi:2-keto-4-pentenoate hydratase/2-oxohepta-3-ene-1,7-dioic acid hydratase in catechol pathway
MRLCVFDDFRLGVWGQDATVVDITRLIDPTRRPYDRMNALIERWDELAPEVKDLARQAGAPLARVRLMSPQPRPTKIVAAAANHTAHMREMEASGLFSGPPQTIETYVGFLKAPSSIIGPAQAIEIPFSDRRVDHEGELGVVIGRRARRVARSEALEYVFGYVPLLDITMRGHEDRPFRKSLDTFTPLGPAIVTADEVPCPSELELKVTVNGHLRQSGSMNDLIYNVPRLIEVYSDAMTLEPGDLIACGTVAGVGPIVPGDEIILSISKLPCLRSRVQSRPLLVV